MSKLTVNFGLLKEQQEELINVNIQVNSLLLEGLESMISAILAEYEMNQKLGFEQLCIPLCPMTQEVSNRSNRE